MAIVDIRRFIEDNTRLRPVPMVPEVNLHVAEESVPLWQRTEEELGEMGLPPPFWAFAWAGGQALARHVLDQPELVRGKRVLDLASGSGLVGIAAMQAGAAHVLAADIDRFALEAIVLNAAVNGVALSVTGADLLGTSEVPAVDVVLAGDIFYEQGTAERALAFLDARRAEGANCLIGDPGRSYLPKTRLRRLAEYSVPVTRDLEDAEIKRTAVWALEQR